MRVIKEQTHGILLNYFAIGEQSHLAVSVLTFFDLDAPDTPLSEQEMWRFVPLELGDNAVLDAAMPKPRGEVLLRAKCFAPAGAARPAAQVEMRVGPIAKQLAVFGPRVWERHATGLAISDPQPFEVIDLTWSNALGGPEYELNPLGRGIDPVTTAAGTPILELPAVEDPAHLIGAPGDRPAPAGFMPLDQTWPQRRRKAGTYDQKWFQQHWPYFPADMNWTFFNTAPDDQQQDGFFQGGEAVTLTNMHAERRLVESRLPRLRQRVFVHQRKDLGSPEPELLFREVPPQLDTVWLFPHALRGILVHRAVLPVADEEAVDVQHLFLVSEEPGEAPKDLEHYQAALARRLDRSVQVDLAPLDDALAQAAQQMKRVQDIPKEVAHRLAVSQGQAPNVAISPRNAAAQCLDVLNGAQARLQAAETRLSELKSQFGHLAKIDLAPLTRARRKFEQLKGTITRPVDQAEAITQKAQAAKKDIQNKVLKALDQPQARQLKEQVQARMAPPAKDLWQEQALALVRQGRHDLALDHERGAALGRLGLRPVAVKRAMAAVLPREISFVPEAWGLDPAPPTTLPAGLVLVAHDGPRITRLAVRPGALDNGADDVDVPGSAAAPFGAGLAPGKCLVRVADPLEAWLVEQDAGDFVGVTALPAPDTPVDQTTADLLKSAPRLLVTLYGRDAGARDQELAAWQAVYPQAEALPLPEKSAILDAHQTGVSLEEWIITALGPQQAPFVPEESPLRAKKGTALAPGLALPVIDAKGLYQAFHDGLSAKMAPMQARCEALKQELPQQMKAAIDTARAQMRHDGLDKHGLDPQAFFNPPPAPPQAEGFLANLKLSEKYDQIRSGLTKANQLTPEHAAALDAQEAKMSRLVEESKARWAEGRAKLPDKQGFTFPDWAKKMLEPFHIDLDDREEMTREKVIARRADGISLKGKKLSGLDLSNLDLSGVDLRGAQLQKTRLAGTKLDGADLSGTIAGGADFSGASFTNGRAVQALMGKANFSQASLCGTDFSKALLKAADLSRADLSGSTLSQTLLEGARLSQARLTGAQAEKGYFMAADLSDADFTQARAKKAVFHRATLSRADFSGSDLSHAIFWDAQADQAVFRDSNLHNARFGGTATVQKGDFRNANLESASLIDADLNGSDFQGSRFLRSYLRNCNLARADLSGVSARRTFFHRTNLEGANLSGANLFLGSLRKARLVNADLSGSNLYGAEMYRAVVGHTNFDQANLKMTLLNQRVELLDDEK